MPGMMIRPPILLPVNYVYLWIELGTIVYTVRSTSSPLCLLMELGTALNSANVKL